MPSSPFYQDEGPFGIWQDQGGSQVAEAPAHAYPTQAHSSQQSWPASGGGQTTEAYPPHPAQSSYYAGDEGDCDSTETATSSDSGMEPLETMPDISQMTEP